MGEQMGKAELLERLETARSEWEAALAAVPEESMEQSGVIGEWSVKDIIAHVSWSEIEALRVLQDHALVSSETDRLWAMEQDDRNAEVYRQNRDRPLREVLAEARGLYPQLLEAVRGLTEEDLNDPARFPGMPADWQPWRIIAGNTYTHYEEHARNIRAWLDAQARDEKSEGIA